MTKCAGSQNRRLAARRQRPGRGGADAEHDEAGPAFRDGIEDERPGALTGQATGQDAVGIAGHDQNHRPPGDHLADDHAGVAAELVLGPYPHGVPPPAARRVRE